jgi:hypothetical protein
MSHKKNPNRQPSRKSTKRASVNVANRTGQFEDSMALQSETIALLGGSRKAKKPAADDSPLAILHRTYLSAKFKHKGMTHTMIKHCPVQIGDEAISTGCRPGLSFKVDTITVEPHNGLQFVLVGQIIKQCGNLGKQRGRCQIAVEDLL